ncbi:hypothetical protein PsYK624_147080 [Phanerochaete sordida]|uniref:Uncharacterized protein n=1 Tax=Phanerochaete sordida TaxID=48140 RepID=A0A9P3GPH1_9APHY|nr:hypothetical protein PsYK624_147080 [Phanerochaete sordida]
MVSTRRRNYDSVIITKAALPELVRAAMEEEAVRVFDDEDEDELDGWDLELPEDAAAYDAMYAPLSPSSSTPTSRTSSPVPPPQTTSNPSSGTKRKASGKKRSKSENDKARDKKKSKAKRQRKAEAQQQQPPHLYEPSAYALAQAADVHPITTAGSTASLSVCKTGWIGKRRKVEAVDPDLATHIAQGRELIKWDGTTTHPLVSKDGYKLALLARKPNDPTWDASMVELAKALEDAQGKMNFGAMRVDRRGNFNTIAAGVSYGGGQKCPGNLKHTVQNRRVVEELLQNPHMKRMVGYTRSMFRIHFPEMYDEYSKNLQSLHADNPLLRPLFAGSPWPAVSINFPPNAYTHIHTDAGNKPNGLCPIYCLGDFDYTKGGHLVLPDLNVVIEFPPGALIFIPSATLRHGNIAVRPGETRTSWTQYAAGGLFRWTEYGNMSWASLVAKSTKRRDAELAKRSTRWQEGLKLFPKFSLNEEDV